MSSLLYVDPRSGVLCFVNVFIHHRDQVHENDDHFNKAHDLELVHHWEEMDGKPQLNLIEILTHENQH